MNSRGRFGVDHYYVPGPWPMISTEIVFPILIAQVFKTLRPH